MLEGRDLVAVVVQGEGPAEDRVEVVGMRVDGPCPEVVVACDLKYHCRARVVGSTPELVVAWLRLGEEDSCTT
jgi:hypothetical protein